MTTVDRKFNLRAFAVLMITFSGLGLPVTGLVNHFYGFAPLSVERHAWMSAHNVLALLFTVFTVWHVVLNRRALWNSPEGPGRAHAAGEPRGRGRRGGGRRCSAGLRRARLPRRRPAMTAPQVARARTISAAVMPW